MLVTCVKVTSQADIVDVQRRPNSPLCLLDTSLGIGRAMSTTRSRLSRLLYILNETIQLLAVSIFFSEYIEYIHEEL